MLETALALTLWLFRKAAKRQLFWLCAYISSLALNYNFNFSYSVFALHLVSYPECLPEQKSRVPAVQNHLFWKHKSLNILDPDMYIFATTITEGIQKSPTIEYISSDTVRSHGKHTGLCQRQKVWGRWIPEETQLIEASVDTQEDTDVLGFINQISF